MNADHSEMDLQQMRYVVAIAEERSFTRAAERCHVVQSALSHQLKALERELGVTLFARDHRRVEPTSAGAAFLLEARAALAAADRAVSAATEVPDELRGTLTIGLIPTVTAVDIPRTLADFHREHPAVKIRLRGGGSDDFISAIVAGEMDVTVLGLADTTPPRGVASRILAREALVAVVPATHPLAHRRRIRLEEIAEDAFADFPEGTPGRAQSDEAFRSAGVRREVAFEVMSTELMLDLVRHGLVTTLLPSGVIPNDDALRTIPTTDGPRRVEYLAWNDFNPSPAAQAFLDMVNPQHPHEST